MSLSSLTSLSFQNEVEHGFRDIGSDIIHLNTSETMDLTLILSISKYYYMHFLLTLFTAGG